jgi:CBS domain containing-hemolysin-like protein
MILLIAIVLLALSSSFICSIFEASLLSATVGDLSARASSGNKGAGILLQLKRERPDDAISAILIINTIAHTIGATLAGAQAAEVFGDEWVGVFSGVLTLLVLIATEIIPKTLGTVYAAPLAGFVGRSLKVMIWGMTPILWVTGFLTRLVAGGHHKRITRAELSAMVQIAAAEGTLPESESRTVRNILRFEEIPVTDVMTPRPVVEMVDADSTVGAFLDNATAGIYSRLPVFKGDRENLLGYVLQRSVLRAATRGEDDRLIETLLRPLPVIDEHQSVGMVLRSMLGGSDHITVIVDEFGGVEGIVTLEDLLETALGEEITDEFDNCADLRQVAIALRDQRVKRMQDFRGEAATALQTPEATEDN